MTRNDPSAFATLKARLYARVLTRPDELALAAHRLGIDAANSEERWSELLDFFVTEWVDREGWTEAERAMREGAAPGIVARWPGEVVTALWVVDGWEGPLVLLRDIATDAEIAVLAPDAVTTLTRRTVLRARVLPWGDHAVFSGEPDVYDEMGVIARLDLLRQWREGPEPELHASLTQLRAAFRRQREEREAFVAHFGADLVVFNSATAMEAALPHFAHFLLNEHRPASLGGRTRAETARLRRTTGNASEPTALSLRLGETLRGPGRPGAIFDEVEGIHFLPALGEFLDHLSGRADHSDVVRAYLDDPGVTALPFLRSGSTAHLATLLGVTDAPISELLAPHKNVDGRAIPSVLPGLDDG